MSMVRVGVLVFGLCTLILHFVQPELSITDDAVSYYMNGWMGRLLSAGLVAMGLGSVVLALRLRGVGGWVWIALWGIGVVIGGLFPPDPRGHWDRPPSVAGMVHGVAALIAFVSLPVGAVLVSRKVRRGLGLAVTSVVLLVVFFACLAPVFMNRPPVALGLVERMLLGALMGWLWVMGSKSEESGAGIL
jgi:hypothetical protein